MGMYRSLRIGDTDREVGKLVAIFFDLVVDPCLRSIDFVDFAKLSKLLLERDDGLSGVIDGSL